MSEWSGLRDLAILWLSLSVTLTVGCYDRNLLTAGEIVGSRACARDLVDSRFRSVPAVGTK